MASGRIRNLDSFDLDGISYVVPGAVLRELERLAANPAKKHEVKKAQEMAGGMRRIIPEGGYADGAILDYVERCGGMVATTDGELKRRIKAAGGSVVSLHNDHMVLESSAGGNHTRAGRRAP